MKKKWLTLFRDGSIQAKMLMIILPLIVLPMMLLAAAGFIISSREMDKTSTHYFKHQENNLRHLVEDLSNSDYFIEAFRLPQENEAPWRELEHFLKYTADFNHGTESAYPQVRVVNPQGEVIAVQRVEDRLTRTRGQVGDAPFFAAVQQRGPGEIYRSPLGPHMLYAMPVYEKGSLAFQGAVALDVVYPIHDFRPTRMITRTFVIVTILSLGLAFFLTIARVRRFTAPIRQLAHLSNLMAAGQRFMPVENDSRDEIGILTRAFNRMAARLEQNEAVARNTAVETETLYLIGKEITAQVALDPTLHSIAKHARALLHADVSLVALRQEESDTFAIQAHSGAGAEEIAAVHFQPGEGLGGRVVATHAPVMVSDYQVECPDSPFLRIVQEAGLHAWLGVPLNVCNTVIGVLYVIRHTPQKFCQEDQRLLSALGDQAAIAIEHARLYEQVRGHAEELELKVEDRTRELQQANLKLEAASRHKSEFLANMSHELRTPMNAIFGFTRLVMRRSKDVLPARQYDNLEKILVSADHLLMLINDILDLSKIEAGRMEVHPRDFTLEPLVDTCLYTVEPMVKSGELHLMKEIETDLPALFTDQDKLKQILMNLLSNAVKFTAEGTITVTARHRDGEIAIAVADTGIGIPEAALERIFEAFRQVDASTTRPYGGTGLGLSISHHLAHLMGGDIAVQSTVGAGSTFTVTFPVHYAGARPARCPAAAPSEEVRIVHPENDRVVLVIDDDPNMLYLLQENLTEAGYHVVGAASGQEGVQKARELRPFAITLDILMPYKDGWQVLHELKDDVATRDIPIMMLSIVDQKDLGYRLGAFDYLLKPFDHEAVLAALARLVPPRGHLMVVDDDPQVADLIRQLLEDEPYEVEAVRDGQEALEAIARQRPDVVLLDLLMPRMDGFAVIEHLQQDSDCCDIPVIVLTAKALTEEEKNLLQQRVLTVIDKQRLECDALIEDLRSALQAYRSSELKA